MSGVSEAEWNYWTYLGKKDGKEVWGPHWKVVVEGAELSDLRRCLALLKMLNRPKKEKKP